MVPVVVEVFEMISSYIIYCSVIRVGCTVKEMLCSMLDFKNVLFRFYSFSFYIKIYEDFLKSFVLGYFHILCKCNHGKSCVSSV